MCFSDPSLTPENLSTVVDSMPNSLWEEFSHYVNIPNSEREMIRKQHSSHRECKQATSLHLISTHPSLSWILVAHALYQMGSRKGGGEGESCHTALDCLQEMFPTGTEVVISIARYTFSEVK